MVTISCSSEKPNQILASLTAEVDGMLEGEIMDNPFDRHYGSMPDGGVKMKINPVGRSLANYFNDSNYLHIEAAQKIGIIPITNLKQAWLQGDKLRKIKSCPEYYVDNLNHSLPYLVPEAKALLEDIGRSFKDSLESRGGGSYRIKVTSVTRTPGSVSRLKRSNGNASENSAHQYGTTFDISYSKFICDSITVPRTQEDLKNLLAEVLKDKRNEGRCYVKYERKQGCFHITARN